VILIKKRKELVKEMSNLCEAKLVGTKYDRWFVEEFVKKIPKIEVIEEIVEKLRALTGNDMVKEFLVIIDFKAAAANKEKEE
jgi:hypothetical protein